MGVADHQLHAIEATGLQAAQEVHPEGLGLRWPNAQANDFTASLRVGSNSDYGRHADDPSALALLEIGGVEPDIGPVPGQRAVQELADPFIDILAQLGHRAFRDAAQPHGLHQLVDAAGRDAADPRLLDHSNQRLLRGFAGFEKAGEIAALPQLRHLQVQGSQSRVQ